MSNHIHYTNCPICGSTDLKNTFSVKDYTVSGETFEIVACNSCSLRFTQDVPDANSILPYYKAEDYISHTDESKGMIGSLYKKVRKRTLIKKRKLIEKETALRNGSLLDVGSGTGAFLNEMKRHSWQTTGLEPDQGARDMAKELYGLNLMHEDEFYNLPENSFDAITLWHVLEHVHDLMGCVQQLKLLLKGKGRLFLAVPNYTSLDATIYQEFWAAYDVPRHLYHFSPRSMQVLMEKNDLKIIDHKQMWYDSVYISVLSNKYKTGKNKWVTALWNGFRSNLKAMSNAKKCSSVIYVISR
jgi:2-polyprenyl-3-methyl-5-hydroxy-6-metoxy-1,4-benzoquinol methylase